MSGLDLLSTYASDSEEDEINDNSKSEENSKRYLSSLVFIIIILTISYKYSNTF